MTSGKRNYSWFRNRWNSSWQFESIFIAFPSAAGYLYAASNIKEIYYLLPVLLIAHGIGVFAGSKDCICVNTNVQNDVCESGYTAKMHKTDNTRCSCTKILCKDCI